MEQQDKIISLIQSLAMRLRFSQFLATFLIIGALILGGCSTDKAGSVTSPTSTATSTPAISTPSETATQAQAETQQPSETTSKTDPMATYVPRLTGKATVTMTVKGKDIEIEVDGDNAPITAGNFVDLVQKGFYNGLTFHRVVTEPQPFVAQGGDPAGNGTGGYIDPQTKTERLIPLEIKAKDAQDPTYSTDGVPNPVLTHKLGAIAMARSQSPDSASSQFYFALADLKFLDGHYAVFGYVTKGLDVVNKIQQGDKIDGAKVSAADLANLKTVADK